MIVALLALVVALGGTSYAAVKLPRNSVGSPQVTNGSITSADVKDRSLRAVDFAQNQLPAGPTGPAGPAGLAGATGPTGPAGSPASAVFTGRADLPGSNRNVSLDGRIVTSNINLASTKAPAVATTLQQFTADIEPAQPGGTGRAFNLIVDGQPFPLCSFTAPATACAMAPGASVAIPAGARIYLAVFYTATSASADVTTVRWGGTLGTVGTG
ncbi:hypothetical protein ABFT23_06370 [Nocardioides sp. C4-1]|uniref:hypothetical protein n=1 Tax=Nocardioides sp. C4-1 TaxID=3151851 RepID=UPI003263C594